MLDRYLIALLALGVAGCAHAAIGGKPKAEGELFVSVAYGEYPAEPSLVFYWKNQTDVPRCVTPETVAGQTARVVNQAGDDVRERDQTVSVQRFEFLKNFVIVPPNGELFVAVPLDFDLSDADTTQVSAEVEIKYVACDFLIQALSTIPFPRSSDVIDEATKSLTLSGSRTVR